jgi:hypothetical protein
VHNVGTTAVLQMPRNTISEFINRTEQIFFWQINFACLHMNDTMVWFDLNDFRKIISPFARIRGALHTATGK